jgi:hypothetical protein
MIAKSRTDPIPPSFVFHMLPYYIQVGAFYYEALFRIHKKVDRVSWAKLMGHFLPYLAENEWLIIWNSAVLVMKPVLYTHYGIEIPPTIRMNPARPGQIDYSGYIVQHESPCSFLEME